MDILDSRILKEASYSPDFYQFLQVGLRDLILLAYQRQAAKRTYERIVTAAPSTKDKEGYPIMGDPGLPERVQPGESYPEKTIGSNDLVELVNEDFGEIIAIHENLLEDDQTGALSGQFTRLGEAMGRKEDKTVYSIINGNPTIYDSQAFFGLNHPGVTGGAADASNDNLYTNVTLSANAVAAIIGIIAGWRGASSEDDLDIMAADLVLPKNLATTGVMLTQSDFIGLAYAAGQLGPAASTAQARNALKDLNIGVISSQRLDRTSTTDWYVKTDFPGFVFQTRSPLRVTMENENSGVRFEKKLIRGRVDKRWAAGIINWRCMAKVS